MITFSMFGKYGRLGNQLFQLACIDTISKSLKTKYFLNYDLQELNDLKRLNINTLENCVWVNEYEYRKLYTENIKFIFNEPDFSYIPNLNSIIPDNTDIVGYFQSKKYFDKNINFTKIFDIDLNQNSNVCSIHIRRTDYLSKEDYHFNLSKTSYYEDAISYIKQKNPEVKFLYFSDDIEFCKEKFGHNIDIYDNGPFDSFKKLLECDYSIMANSSFSWWGSILNKKIVISPQNWFGEKGPKDYSHVYCDEWVKL